MLNEWAGLSSSFFSLLATEERFDPTESCPSNKASSMLKLLRAGFFALRAWNKLRIVCCGFNFFKNSKLFSHPTFLRLFLRHRHYIVIAILVGAT